jgi:hypothetical protein
MQTIQGLVENISFQSVIGTITLSGKMPILSSLTITAGRVLLISVPMVGSRRTNQISLLRIGFAQFTSQPDSSSKSSPSRTVKVMSSGLFK